MDGPLNAPVCFLAGESAARSWRYVVPLLEPGTEPIFHELLGVTATGAGYSWQDEVDSLGEALAATTAAHLVGFSGGATLALAYLAAYPDRVASLTLVEPAWSFLPLTGIEAAYYERLAAALRGPASAERDAFRRLLVQPDVELPPARPDLVQAALDREASGLPTPLRAMTQAMQRHVVDPAAFARYDGRVLIVVGGRSHAMWRAQGDSLAAAFPVSRLEVFELRHHLDPPQKAETERFVAAMRWAWAAR